MNEHDGDDLVGAYVLDALEPQERAAFEAHLSKCHECQAEVAQLRLVVDVLPLSVEQSHPPESLKERVLRAAGADQPSGLVVLSGSKAGRSRLSWLSRRESMLGIAAAVVIAFLGVWNYQLHQQGGTTQSPQQAAMLDAIAHGAKVTPVTGTALAPGATAVMVQPRTGSHAYFAVEGLPASPSGRVYQLWLVRGNSPTSVTVFTYSGDGWQYIELPRSTRGYPLTAVTNEPGPNGSLAPTTKPVLAGRLV